MRAEKVFRNSNKPLGNQERGIDYNVRRRTSTIVEEAGKNPSPPHRPGYTNHRRSKNQRSVIHEVEEEEDERGSMFESNYYNEEDSDIKELNSLLEMGGMRGIVEEESGFIQEEEDDAPIDKYLEGGQAIGPNILKGNARMSRIQSARPQVYAKFKKGQGRELSGGAGAGAGVGGLSLSSMRPVTVPDAMGRISSADMQKFIAQDKYGEKTMHPNIDRIRRYYNRERIESSGFSESKKKKGTKGSKCRRFKVQELGGKELKELKVMGRTLRVFSKTDLLEQEAAALGREMALRMGGQYPDILGSASQPTLRLGTDLNSDVPQSARIDSARNLVLGDAHGSMSEHNEELPSTQVTIMLRAHVRKI